MSHTIFIGKSLTEEEEAAAAAAAEGEEEGEETNNQNNNNNNNNNRSKGNTHLDAVALCLVDGLVVHRGVLHLATARQD
jgi:hypothetical protein